MEALAAPSMPCFFLLSLVQHTIKTTATQQYNLVTQLRGAVIFASAILAQLPGASAATLDALAGPAAAAHALNQAALTATAATAVAALPTAPDFMPKHAGMIIGSGYVGGQGNVQGFFSSILASLSFSFLSLFFFFSFLIFV